MAHVTGPVTTLPKMVCDDCGRETAVIRVQGETDSFGAEWHDLCVECNNKRLEEERNRDRSGTCEWCKKFVAHRVKVQDIDEGMRGPVYDVCPACKKKQDEYIRRLDDEYELYGDW